MSEQLPQGQILTDSEFGKLLTKLAMESRTIVEIGSWFGGGSTQCFVDGMKAPSVLWCVEVDPVKCDAIRARYRGHPLWHRIVVIENTAIAAIDLGCIPPEIDLLLLDGDDVTTDDEFDALWRRCRIIALDDTNERKNKRQRRLLLDWNWEVISDNPSERNGYAIFRAPKICP